MANIDPQIRKISMELAFIVEELHELKRARSIPITFDDDPPETTPERAIRFRRVNPHRVVNVN